LSASSRPSNRFSGTFEVLCLGSLHGFSADDRGFCPRGHRRAGPGDQSLAGLRQRLAGRGLFAALSRVENAAVRRCRRLQSVRAADVKRRRRPGNRPNCRRCRRLGKNGSAARPDRPEDHRPGGDRPKDQGPAGRRQSQRRAGGQLRARRDDRLPAERRFPGGGTSHGGRVLRLSAAQPRRPLRRILSQRPGKPRQGFQSLLEQPGRVHRPSSVPGRGTTSTTRCRR